MRLFCIALTLVALASGSSYAEGVRDISVCVMNDEVEPADAHAIERILTKASNEFEEHISVRFTVVGHGVARVNFDLYPPTPESYQPQCEGELFLVFSNVKVQIGERKYLGGYYDSDSRS